MSARKTSNKTSIPEPAPEIVIDGKYISELTATAQKLSGLVSPLPLQAILMWIDAHADDEETIETLNRFTFLYTKKYRQGRW